MDEFFSWIWAHAHQEIAIVSGAPFLTFMAVIVIGIAAFFGQQINGLNSAIEAKDATIAHKDSLLGEYKDKLHVSNPTEAQEQLAALQSSLNRLEALVIRPQRSVPDDQRERLLAALKAHILPGNPVLGVRVTSTPDTESCRYLKTLDGIMKEGGVSVFHLPHGRHDIGESGVIFYHAAGLPIPPEFQLLIDAFTQAGISHTVRADIDGGDVPYLFVTPEDP